MGKRLRKKEKEETRVTLKEAIPRIRNDSKVFYVRCI